MCTCRKQERKRERVKELIENTKKMRDIVEAWVKRRRDIKGKRGSI
jgi:hypothetical protein